MAQLAETAQQHAERLLAQSTGEWTCLPRVAAEIDGWDEADRIDFLAEWSLEEDRLETLREYADDDVLTPEQCGRYHQLLELVAKHRPIIEALFDG